MSLLSDDFTVIDVDIHQWLNLLSALPLRRDERGTLYILYHREDILQAFHSRRGRIPTPTLSFTNPGEAAERLLEEQRRLEEAEAVVMVEQGLPHRLLAKIQEASASKSDILSLLESVRRSLQEELGRGLAVAPLQAWRADVLELMEKVRSVISMLPDNAVSLMVVFEGEQVWTSLIALKEDGRLRQVATTQALEPPKVLLSDWREDYPKLLELVRRRFGQVALGLFTDVEVFRFLMRSENPVAYLRQARRAGQIILDPLPRRIAFRL